MVTTLDELEGLILRVFPLHTDVHLEFLGEHASSQAEAVSALLNVTLPLIAVARAARVHYYADGAAELCAALDALDHRLAGDR